MVYCGPVLSSRALSDSLTQAMVETNQDSAADALWLQCYSLD